MRAPQAVLACCTILALFLPFSAAFLPVTSGVFGVGGWKTLRVRGGIEAKMSDLMLVTNKMCPFAQKAWIVLEEKKATHGLEFKLEEIGLCKSQLPPSIPPETRRTSVQSVNSCWSLGGTRP